VQLVQQVQQVPQAQLVPQVLSVEQVHKVHKVQQVPQALQVHKGQQVPQALLLSYRPKSLVLQVQMTATSSKMLLCNVQLARFSWVEGLVLTALSVKIRRSLSKKLSRFRRMLGRFALFNKTCVVVSIMLGALPLGQSVLPHPKDVLTLEMG
jgi:hypothetical protein